MAGDTCTVAAMWAPLQRRRRNATTWAATAAGSLVGGLHLEQLRIGQDDSKVVVQAVEKSTHFGRLVHVHPSGE